MSKWKEGDAGISNKSLQAMTIISELSYHGRGHIEFGAERLCAVITHAQYELKILLKNIKLDVNNNEHEDETSKHIKRSFEDANNSH